MDIEAGVAPGEYPLRPLGAEKFFIQEPTKHLPGEEVSQPRVVQARDPVEGPRPVHAALRHQQMQVRVKVDPFAEGLDGGDDSRGIHMLFFAIAAAAPR